MSPRQKKPPVTSERRQDWLRRNEDGQSPPKIAAADGFDARTVRRHLDTARQEKETKEARATVLRNALERHYLDLCRYAERLGGQLSGVRISGAGMPELPAEPYEEQLEAALRQHLPRSPIWGLLNQRQKLHASKADLLKGLSKKIEADVASDPHLLNKLAVEENRVIPGLISAFKSMIDQWLRGQPGLNVQEQLIAYPEKNGLVQLYYGAFDLGKVKAGTVELVRPAIIDWTARIKGWDEYHDLEKTFRDLERVEKGLHDEVAVIALRRVVPGRCRYCPV